MYITILHRVWMKGVDPHGFSWITLYQQVQNALFWLAPIRKRLWIVTADGCYCGQRDTKVPCSGGSHDKLSDPWCCHKCSHAEAAESARGTLSCQHCHWWSFYGYSCWDFETCWLLSVHFTILFLSPHWLFILHNLCVILFLTCHIPL